MLKGVECEDRVGRSDVRAVLGDPSEPGFWPTRGRRGGSEEAPPPFWANRGRGAGSAEEAPPFWANRGRELPSTACPPGAAADGRLFADEPRWILIQRRDAQVEDPFWVARGRRRFSH